MSFVTRFAPSPTGHLHLGSAYAAKQAFEMAEKKGGTCLLRIEDIDQTRCRREYEESILDDLSWMGFQWPEPFRRQSDHFADYEIAFERLRYMRVVYPCFLTRSELNMALENASIEVSPAGERPYPGPSEAMSKDEFEGRLERGEAPAWRLSLNRARDLVDFNQLTFDETSSLTLGGAGTHQATPDWLGDVVLVRKDSPTSYHFAVTHDDALQGITHVVRGIDLYHSTHIHVLLQRLMGWPTPIYHHHGLMLGADGQKFSKRDHSKTIRSLRAEGVTPDKLHTYWTEPHGIST